MLEFRLYKCIFFSLSGEYPQHQSEVHSTISAPAAFITTDCDEFSEALSHPSPHHLGLFPPEPSPRSAAQHVRVCRSPFFFCEFLAFVFLNFLSRFASAHSSGGVECKNL